MVWNKGLTKYTHPSVMKTFLTMKSKNIDNFKNWRTERQKLGIIPSEKSSFKRSRELAELIGVILGDGSIYNYPRTEGLTITGNFSNTGFTKRYTNIVERIFNKQPTVGKATDSNAVRIRIYQKYISKRTGIPCGNRKDLKIHIHSWIKQDRRYLISILRGLFEAEGYLSVHRKTYTYNFQFSNRNDSLLKFVEDSLIYLGFHPEIREYYVRLRRRVEVERFKKLIKFRVY
jgi:hypothetical protein